MDKKDKLRQYIKQEILNILLQETDDDKEIYKETTMTGGEGAEGYMTPKAFTGGADAPLKRHSEVLGYKLVGTGNKNKKDSYASGKVNESVYFRDKDLTESQKIALAMREVRDNLVKVEKVMERSIRLKKESGQEITHGKNTMKALKRINEKVVKLMSIVHNMI